MVYLSFFSQIAQWFQTWAANIKIPQVAALVIGILAAWFGLGLFPVAVICCAVVFLLEKIL